jgi:hypothetical protein
MFLHIFCPVYVCSLLFCTTAGHSPSVWERKGARLISWNYLLHENQVITLGFVQIRQKIRYRRTAKSRLVIHRM